MQRCSGIGEELAQDDKGTKQLIVLLSREPVGAGFSVPWL
jgi:hypothetical protein